MNSISEPSQKRRDFLKSTGSAVAAALAFPTLIPSRVLGENAPSKQITVGFIGMGDQGVGRNLAMFLDQPDARALAVCDVFEDRRERAKAMVDDRYGNADCRAYGDFREMLARDDIDAIMISTPDHWHALMSLMALRAGKDVICEKPTLTIEEGRLVADLVAEKGKVFQTSTEDRSLFVYHRLAEVVRNGRIGKLQRIEVSLPAGKEFPNEEEVPVPKGLDYDLWLGPAPEAPFTPNRTELMHWRHIWDYSGGMVTDWGMHLFDTAQWANDTERTGPISVEGKGTVNEGSMYNTFVDYEVTYRYANGVELQLVSGGTGIKFIGSDGWVGSRSWNSGLEGTDRDWLREPIPEDGLHLFTCPEGEHRNFLDCVKSRQDPYFPAEIGHRCATICHLGNIAMQLGRKLSWDPEREAFVDDREANAKRSRAMRDPWSLT